MDDHIDNENTPLLQNASASSSNANDYSHSGLRQRNQNSLSDRTKTADEEWLETQKDFISKSGKKASIRKRVAFKCDTSRIGRYWEFFDALLSATFAILYIWVSFISNFRIYIMLLSILFCAIK
jgi:hypothetical protein